MAELVTLGVVVAAVAALGIALGILAAPALTRWSDRDDEEPDARDG